MSDISSGEELDHIIRLLSSLPGLGPRSAQRVVLHLVKKKEVLFEPLSRAMLRALESVVCCDICGNVDTKNPCSLCNDTSRDRTKLVVVEDIADLWALERAGVGNLSYHVLGGVLAPLDGVGPTDLTIDALRSRLESGEVKELILALNATVEGQSTAHYLKESFSAFDIEFTRLAHGVPVGGELDYLDEGTLNAAMTARTQI